MATSKFFRTRWAGAALVVGALAVGGACSKKKTEPQAITQEQAASIPAPAGTNAQFYIASPQTTWEGARALIEAPGILPASASLMLTTVLGLPPTAAGQFQETSPLTGVLLQPEPSVAPKALPDAGADAGAPVGAPESVPSLVLSVAVKNGGEMLAVLSKGADASYTAEKGPDSSTKLVPVPGKGQEQLKLAVYGNRLVAADSWDALAKAGRYVATGMPAQKLTGQGLVIDVSEKALAGPIAEGIESFFASAALPAAAAGQPLPYAQLDQTGAQLSALVKSVKSAQLALVPSAEGLEVRLSAVPLPGGAAEAALAKTKSGSVDALLAMPADSVLAIYVAAVPEGLAAMEPPTDPAADPTAKKAAELLKQLVGSLSGRVLASLRLSATPTELAMMLLGPPGKALASKLSFIAEVAAKDPDTTKKSIDGLVALVDGAKPTSIKVTGFGPAQQAIVQDATDTVGLAWGIKDGELVLAVAAAPKQALEQFTSNKATLDQNPWIKQTLLRGSPTAAGALVAQLPVPGPTMAVVIRSTATKEAGAIDAYISAALIRRGMKMLQQGAR